MLMSEWGRIVSVDFDGDNDDEQLNWHEETARQQGRVDSRRESGQGSLSGSELVVVETWRTAYRMGSQKTSQRLDGGKEASTQVCKCATHFSDEWEHHLTGHGDVFLRGNNYVS